MSELESTLLDPVPDEVETPTMPLGFDEAFTLHHRAVFRTARALLRDTALAEDVTQEVFLRLYRNLDAAPQEDLLRPWLLHVTMNVARNMLRSQNRVIAREDEFANQAHAEAGREKTPEVEHERRIEIAEARRALEKIKEPMRSSLLLKEQGLSYREIARALSVGEANVHSLILRGQKEFKKIYGGISRKRSKPKVARPIVGVGSLEFNQETTSEESTFKKPKTNVKNEIQVGDEEVDSTDAEVAMDSCILQVEDIRRRMQQEQETIDQLRIKTRSLIARLHIA